MICLEADGNPFRKLLGGFNLETVRVLFSWQGALGSTIYDTGEIFELISKADQRG